VFLKTLLSLAAPLHTNARTRALIHAHTHTRTHTHTHTHTHAYTHACIHTRAHTFTHTHTHTHTPLCCDAHICSSSAFERIYLCVCMFTCLCICASMRLRVSVCLCVIVSVCVCAHITHAASPTTPTAKTRTEDVTNTPAAEQVQLEQLAGEDAEWIASRREGTMLLREVCEGGSETQKSVCECMWCGV